MGKAHGYKTFSKMWGLNSTTISSLALYFGNALHLGAFYPTLHFVLMLARRAKCKLSS